MMIRVFGVLAGVCVLAASGCATSPQYRDGGGYNGGYSDGGRSNAPYSSNRGCQDCGTVTRIETVGRGQNVPNATGAVLGGIVGAAAGHEISDRTGGSKGNQNIAAVAGAVGGAIAGNAIQNNVQEQTTYQLYVRYDDGRTTMITQRDLNGIREGSAVLVSGGRASLR